MVQAEHHHCCVQLLCHGGSPAKPLAHPGKLGAGSCQRVGAVWSWRGVQRSRDVFKVPLLVSHGCAAACPPASYPRLPLVSARDGDQLSAVTSVPQ